MDLSDYDMEGMVQGGAAALTNYPATEMEENWQGGFLEQFFHFVSLLKSLNLLHCIADHAVADVIHMKVRESIRIESLIVCTYIHTFLIE